MTEPSNDQTVRIHIPTPLRGFTAGLATATAGGATVGEVLERLVAAHPELRAHLFADNGSLRSFVNLYLNDEDIRYLRKDETPVRHGDELSIVPSIAGG